MALLSLATLIVKETKSAIYQKAIDIAILLDLPVTSWQPGDPTRSLYHHLSEVMETVECAISEYIESGFLDFAEDEWLIILADQVYGVTAVAATFATTTVTLSNASGALYTIDAGDLTFKNTSTGKTYHNTDGGTLAVGPGTTLDLAVEADEAGSDSSAGATEIGDLVTTLLGVTVSNATAAVGVDEEEDEALRTRCRDKLGALSPNGPRDAYTFVALSPDLTGTTNITRARSVADSTTGEVTVYLAGPSGAVAEVDRALVETALLEFATPLTITLTTLSATNVVVPVTYTLHVYTRVGKTDAEAKAEILTALTDMFAVRSIGGDVITVPPGALFLTLIEKTILDVYPVDAFSVTVSVPTGDTSLTIGQVAALGTVSPTVVFVSNP